MALITCKECGREVSEHALTCPYCETTAPGSDPEKSAEKAARKSVHKTIIGFVVVSFLYYQIYLGPQFFCGDKRDTLFCKFLYAVSE